MRIARNEVTGAPLHSVALILSVSHAYGREVFRGMVDYSLAHARWRLQVETQAGEQTLLPRADGILLGVCNPAMIRRMRRYRGRLVLASSRAQLDGIPVVRSDDRAIGRMGARHLLDLGLRQLRFVGEGVLTPVPGRWDGFAAEAGKAGVEAVLMRSHPTNWRTDWQPLLRELRSLPKPVGIMAATDLIGLAIIRACHETGLRVPEDVAVLGVQNDELLCAACHPHLSSIRTGANRIGFEAARVLDEWIRQGQPPGYIFEFGPLDVVARQSTDVVAVPDRRLAEALSFIRRHAQTGCTVRDVLAHTGGGRRALEQAFMRHLRRSPHDEIRRVRITQARSLLLNTDLKIEDIAARVGYGYLPNLVKAFRQEIGCTPGDYRRHGLSAPRPRAYI